MTRPLPTVAFLLLACSLAAQGTEPAAVTLSRMVDEAGDDTDRLVAAAAFARENQLGGEARKILEKVLGLDPDHRAAHEALGHREDGGEWQAEVDGIWVPVARLGDAEKGIYFHQETPVTRWEKERLLDGWQRHVYTGLLISGDDVEKASAGQFPLGDGEWGDLQAADAWHANSARPWILRSEHFYVVTTLPHQTITQEIIPAIEGVVPELERVAGGRVLAPAEWPVVVLLPSTDAYVAFGERYGASGSAHGAFLADPAEFTVDIAGVRRPAAAANWGAEGWGYYYARHAAALALANRYFGSEATAVPDWFRRGLAGRASRLYAPEITQFFGQQHLKAGCPDDLGKWLAGFSISGDNPTSGRNTNDYNVFEAGLLIDYCLSGGDADATAAMRAVTAAIVQGQGVAAAVRELQTRLGGKAAEVAAYLEKIAG
jgi:hypothetical protein